MSLSLSADLPLHLADLALYPADLVLHPTDLVLHAANVIFMESSEATLFPKVIIIFWASNLL